MKWWQIALIAVGVILLHGCLFWLISDFKPLPRRASNIPQPNFSAKEAWVVDPASGETVLYQEFRVRTKLAMPDVLMEGTSSNSTPTLERPIP